MIRPLVFVAGGKPTTDAHIELGIELMFLIQRADDLLRIEQVIALHQLDVPGGHFALFVYAERKLAGFMILSFEFHALEIEDDVGHVLDHAWQRGEFMLRPGDFHRRDGRAFERGEQDAPE